MQFFKCPHIICWILNKSTFFQPSTVALKIEDKVIHTDTKYQDFLDNPVSQRFYLSRTDPEQIELSIKSLSSSKSTGPASIPTNVL